MSTPGPEGATKRAIEISGYAIVSDDDRIAGADGLVPPSLRNEKDWDYYQRALASSDLIVFGHRSHELEPNVRGDTRLVISSRVTGLERRADAWWWSPARMSWPEAAKSVLPLGGRVAAPGGQGVFDLFLKIGFDAFHLTRAHGVMLPGGRAIFSACDAGLSAEAVLAEAGLRASEKIPLDPAHGVELTVWRRSVNVGSHHAHNEQHDFRSLRPSRHCDAERAEISGQPGSTSAQASSDLDESAGTIDFGRCAPKRNSAPNFAFLLSFVMFFFRVPLVVDCSPQSARRLTTKDTNKHADVGAPEWHSFPSMKSTRGRRSLAMTAVVQPHRIMP